MSKVMQILEQLGQNANLQTPENIEEYLTSAALTNELKQALIEKDELTLKNLLDIPTQVWCSVIVTPEDDESEEDGDDEKISNTFHAVM